MVIMEQVNKQYPAWLKKFIDIYDRLSTDNLELLSDLYHDDIEFRDPLHKIKGIEALNDYFNGLYQNLNHCQFSIHNVVFDEKQAAVYWAMNYQHPKLNGGEEILVEGSSFLKGHEDKVYYHRDYLDLGSMLYEHVPFLGAMVRWLKRKAVK